LKPTAVRTDIGDDGIATITLDRPEKHNALDETLIGELREALELVGRSAEARALVLCGNGPSFCAGADLNWMKRTSRYDEARNFRDAAEFTELLTALDTMGKPTIARVHGPAYGGGVGLVAACDIAIGSREALFSFSEVRLGLIPAMISPYAVAAIGERYARRYMLTAERIDAAEAFRIGLLHDICEAEALDATVGATLAHIMRGGPHAIAACKQLIARVAHAPVDAATREYTARAIARARAGAEGREGIAAFLDKRPPAWTETAVASARKRATRRKTK